MGDIRLEARCPTMLESFGGHPCLQQGVTVKTRLLFHLQRLFFAKTILIGLNLTGFRPLLVTNLND